MDQAKVRVGHDYWWDMPPRPDGSPRRSVIHVTSVPRLDKVGKDRDRDDYVVDAVFLGREGPNEPTRWPVQVRYLNPVAYAQDLKKGDVVSWQKNDPARGFYYVMVTVEGPRDDDTGMVPVVWHHNRASRDGTKPAGDSRHEVPNRFLFRKETADVMRATQPSFPQRAAQSNTHPNPVRQAPTPPGVKYATEEDLQGVTFDVRIVAMALLAGTDNTKLVPQTVKHLKQIAAGVKPTA